MTFGKPRCDKLYEWELIRFSSKLNTTVTGGFSKLLSYFIKRYNPTNILTYCHRGISSGDVYLKNKFNLINITEPGFQYINPKYHNTISREIYQKHKLQYKLQNYNPNITTWENMQLNGYDRIWDCGSFKFLYTK